MNTRSRAYCFTVNNWDDDDCAECILLADEARYLIVGFEEGEEKNTPHLQCYVYFENARLFSSMKKKFPTAHFEQARGTPIENKQYCSKEGDFIEFGDLPVLGKVSWEVIEEAMLNPKQHPHTYTMYRKSYQEIINNEKKTMINDTKFYKVAKFKGMEYINTCFDYFDWDVSDKGTIAVLTKLEQLEAYPCTVDKIIFKPDDYDEIYSLWARGMPIFYKYGYEYKVINPKILIIVTETPNFYPLYKNI